jgi:hypothetical protein
MAKTYIIAPLASAGEFPVTTSDQIQISDQDSRTVQDVISELAANSGNAENITYNGNQSVKEAITELQQEVGLPAGGGGGGSLSNKLDDLREYITTLIPPTLTAELNKSTVYLINSTPNDLKINVRINRPLEPPLKLVINGTEAKTIDDNTKKSIISWSEQWAPTRTSIGSKSAEVAIVDDSDSNIEYVSKSVSCKFSAPVYYWVDAAKLDRDDLAEIPTEAKSNAESLTASHPTSVVFGATNHYCYYAYPAAFNSPSFFIGGVDQTSGFDELTKNNNTISKTINGIAISYSIYRTNNALTSSTAVNIK